MTEYITSPLQDGLVADRMERNPGRLRPDVGVDLQESGPRTGHLVAA
jgi:hypothetical protein